MKNYRFGGWVVLVAMALAACSGSLSASTPTPEPPTPTSPPTEAAPTAEPTVEPTATAPALTFEAAIYEDAQAGFKFQYPSGWTLDGPQVGGDRGYYIQLTSWAHEPGVISEEAPPGGSRMDVSVLLWEPVNDLDAYVEVRKTAWDVSGFSVQAEVEVILPGDRRAIEFIILSPAEGVYFLMMPIGDRYLEFSGSGDLDLLSEIARTVEITPISY